MLTAVLAKIMADQENESDEEQENSETHQELGDLQGQLDTVVDVGLNDQLPHQIEHQMQQQQHDRNQQKHRQRVSKEEKTIEWYEIQARKKAEYQKRLREERKKDPVKLEEEKQKRKERDARKKNLSMPSAPAPLIAEPSLSGMSSPAFFGVGDDGNQAYISVAALATALAPAQILPAAAVAVLAEKLAESPSTSAEAATLRALVQDALSSEGSLGSAAKRQKKK